MNLLRYWWRLDEPVDRRRYALNGFGLAVTKYIGDVLLVFLGTGRFWTPFDYLASVRTLFAAAFRDAPPWLMPLLVLWAIPFIWIGVTLTMRRAINAGQSPWWSLAFFLPYANYLLMIAFCLWPTAPEGDRQPSPAPTGTRMNAALAAAATGIAIGLVMIVVSVNIMGVYGVGLFFGTPFAMGAAAGFIFNRTFDADDRETLVLNTVMFLFVAGVALLVAVEGAACIAMALPGAFILGGFGGLMGRSIARLGRRDLKPLMFGLLAVPLSVAMEPAASTGRVMHEVRSSVEIDAPPAQVWTHVIAFAPMPEPADWLFRSGIAYPQYARIDGAGVGAIRYCVFSTGPFVEPITAWEPGRRLAFDVASSPPPMRELSLYAHVTPPHLDGFLRSRRGEFRLVALPGGRTRLEGSTWYQIEMAPEGYWQLYSDYLIHRIHQRVLEHVKAEVEKSAG